MFDSLAILQTEVDRALGNPGREFLEPEDVTAAAIECLALRGLQAAQSTYARVSKHVQFYPSSRNASVNAASDMAVPSYVERRISTAPNEAWTIVPTVHPSLLSGVLEYRTAWERDSDGLRLLLNYTPTGIYHRLWYYADPKFAQMLNDPLGLPTRFGYLFLHDTILNVIPSVMHRAAAIEAAGGQGLTLAQLKAIETQIAHSQAKVDEWEPLWKSEKDASKAPRGRNRRPVLGRMGLG